MPNGYPCPACGDLAAALFEIAGFDENSDSAKPAYSNLYACAACIADAKVKQGAAIDFSKPHQDITSTNNPNA